MDATLLGKVARSHFICPPSLHSVRAGIGEHRGEPAVAGGEKGRRIVIVRNVPLVVVAQGTVPLGSYSEPPDGGWMDVVVCRNRSILNMLGLKVKPGCSVSAQLLFTISKS
jgi:hypothetical protein